MLGRRLRFGMAQLGRKPARSSVLDALVEIADLPGTGWRQLDERTWRAGETVRGAAWAGNARAAGSIVGWRSFQQAQPRRWLWTETVVLPTAEDARAALDSAGRLGLRNLRTRVRVVADRDVAAPTVPGASTVRAREQLTEGPSGAGRVLTVSLLRERALAVIAASGPDGAWGWAEVAAIAQSQAQRLGP
jgi:hypothetical protein